MSLEDDLPRSRIKLSSDGVCPLFTEGRPMYSKCCTLRNTLDLLNLGWLCIYLRQNPTEFLKAHGLK